MATMSEVDEIMQETEYSIASEAEIEFASKTIIGRFALWRLGRINSRIEFYCNSAWECEDLLKVDDVKIKTERVYADYEYEIRNLRHYVDTRNRVLQQIRNPHQLIDYTFMERIKSLLTKQNKFEQFLNDELTFREKFWQFFKKGKFHEFIQNELDLSPLDELEV